MSTQQDPESFSTTSVNKEGDQSPDLFLHGSTIEVSVRCHLPYFSHEEPVKTSRMPIC